MEKSMTDIAGFDQVLKHFGKWPSFHDAVVERFVLDLQGSSLISLRTWNTSSEIDERGYFRTTDHATINFYLTQISAFELSGSDLYAGGVLFGLRFDHEGDGFRIELDPSLGPGGWISCRGIHFELRVIDDTESFDQQPTVPSL
jgi:hypothetical protein